MLQPSEESAGHWHRVSRPRRSCPWDRVFASHADADALILMTDAGEKLTCCKVK